MKFGVFDHLDRNDLALDVFYEQRLKIVEAYDRGGFYAYHTAEHHATPLGLAASPSVFLAAVAQRTQRLRFGPLVYTLPLHHPLRLVEEICMLDQLSRGRFELGVGRGISPIETAYFGVDPDHRQKMYLEALQIVRQALTSRTLTFHGQFYDYADVPMELEPFQKPHPPLWSGTGTPEGGEAAGRSGFNMVANAPTPQVRAITERYRAAFTATHTPFVGLARFVIMGGDRRRGARDRAPSLSALAPALPPSLPPARHHPERWANGRRTSIRSRMADAASRARPRPSRA